MNELLRTNDIVALGLMCGLLDQAGVPNMIADAYASAVDGSIGAVPRRLLVGRDFLEYARAVLVDAGLAEYLPGPGA